MWSVVTGIGEAFGQIIKSQRKAKAKVIFSLLQKMKLLKMKKKAHCYELKLSLWPQ